MKLKYVEERFPTPFEFGKRGDDGLPCFTCGFGTGAEFDIYADPDEMAPLQKQINAMQEMLHLLLEEASEPTVNRLWFNREG
jgi:hypothetical protein